MDIPKFEDYSELKTLDGDKVKIDDILNKPIVVTGYTVMNSKYKNKSSEYCTKVQFYYTDDEKQERRVFFSGSMVIKDQIENIEKKLNEQDLPLLFQTTVKKVGNYYSFV